MRGWHVVVPATVPAWVLHGWGSGVVVYLLGWCAACVAVVRRPAPPVSATTGRGCPFAPGNRGPITGSVRRRVATVRCTRSPLARGKIGASESAAAEDSGSSGPGATEVAPVLPADPRVLGVGRHACRANSLPQRGRNHAAHRLPETRDARRRRQPFGHERLRCPSHRARRAACASSCALGTSARRHLRLLM